MKKYFITAPGTGMGKTYLLTGICAEFIKQGKSVEAIKPVTSGFNPEDDKSDLELIRKALGHEPGFGNIAKISPWRFKTPVSPDIAARLENQPIDFAALVEFCLLQNQKQVDYLFIEGAGGIMTPLTAKETFLDLIKALKIPVLFITGNHLGCLSQTLTALEVCIKSNIEVKGVILNENMMEESYDELGISLRNFSSIPLLKLSSGAAFTELAKIIM